MVPPFPFPVVWRQKLVQLIKPGIWRLSGTRGAGDCGATTSVSGVFWRQYWLQLIRQGIWRLLEHVVAAIVAPSFPFPVGFAAKRPG